MFGTIVNCLAIITGGLIGLVFHGGIPEKYNQTVMQALSLAVLLIGIKSALQSADLLIVVISLCLGSFIEYSKNQNRQYAARDFYPAGVLYWALPVDVGRISQIFRTFGECHLRNRKLTLLGATNIRP